MSDPTDPIDSTHLSNLSNSRKRSLHVPHVGHKAPIPLGARVGHVICSSGIAGKDPASGVLPADAATQAAHAFTNMRALLAAGGATLADVVRLAVTVKDDSVREAVNTEWLAAFPDPDDRPARHIAVHDLQHGLWLQLELMAVLTSDRSCRPVIPAQAGSQ